MKKILVLANLAVLAAAVYAMSFTEDRPDLVFTNSVAEFVAEPLAFIWLFTCCIGMLWLSVSDD